MILLMFPTFMIASTTIKCRRELREGGQIRKEKERKAKGGATRCPQSITESQLVIHASPAGRHSSRVHVVTEMAFYRDVLLWGWSSVTEGCEG